MSELTSLLRDINKTSKRIAEILEDLQKFRKVELIGKMAEMQK